MPHTMRLTMNETQKGSEDGLTLKEFEKGETYDVAISLAQVFLNEKWAKPAEKEPDPDDGEITQEKINSMKKQELIDYINDNKLEIDVNQNVPELKEAVILSEIETVT